MCQQWLNGTSGHGTPGKSKKTLVSSDNMVATRSDAKSSRKDVRFNEGVSVRRILDFSEETDRLSLSTDSGLGDDHAEEIQFLRGQSTNEKDFRLPSDDNTLLLFDSTCSEMMENPNTNGTIESNSKTKIINCPTVTDDSTLKAYDHTCLAENTRGYYDEDTIRFSHDTISSTTRLKIIDSLIFILLTISSYLLANYVYAKFGHTFYILFLSVGLCFVSWMMTYFDSATPGVVPPSPFSPAHYRRVSGHSFHLSYIMSFINGLAVLVINLWLYPLWNGTPPA